MLHISETSESSKSPEDTRLPEWKNPSNEQPTTGAHQTQFAYRTNTSIDEIIQIQNGGVLPSPSEQPKADYSKVPGVFPVESYADTYQSTRYPGSTGVAPQTVYAGGGYDVDMSDNSGQIHSTGLTPGSSTSQNRSNSTTAFTPPEMPTDESTNSQNTTGIPPMSGTHDFYSSFPPTALNMYAPQGSDSTSNMSDGNVNMGNGGNYQGRIPASTLSHLQDNDPFKMTAAWDQQIANGASPLNLTGMTPHGGWEAWET